GAEVKEKYQKYGELIAAYMHEIRRYDKEAVVFDYYTNQELTIPLDPEIAPNDNAQLYYRKYNELKVRVTPRREQLDKAYSDREYFLNLLHQTDAITTWMKWRKSGKSSSRKASLNSKVQTKRKRRIKSSFMSSRR